MTWRNYGQETRPDGKWVRTVEFCSVIGLEDNIEGFLAFAAAVDRAKSKGLRFGVDIEPDPENEHTPHALRVVGVAQSKPLFRPVDARQWVLGHVWHKIADELHNDLVSREVPIAAELLSIHHNPGNPEVKIAILAPPGHSRAKRESARSKRLLDEGSGR